MPTAVTATVPQTYRIRDLSHQCLERPYESGRRKALRKRGDSVNTPLAVGSPLLLDREQLEELGECAQHTEGYEY